MTSHCNPHLFGSVEVAHSNQLNLVFEETCKGLNVLTAGRSSLLYDLRQLYEACRSCEVIHLYI